MLAPRDVTWETCLLLRVYYEAFTRTGIRLCVAHAPPELQQGLAARKDDAPPLVDWLVETF